MDKNLYEDRKTDNLISIIIPVYNAAKYLNRCIESILQQSYKNWELILLDDGSTDDSFAICESYMRLDSRIKVFHQANAGVSAARNKGIELAVGGVSNFL